MSRCPNCQAEVDPETNFCPNCGAEFSGTAAEEKDSTSQNGWEAWKIIAASVLFIYVFAVIIFGESSPNDEYNGSPSSTEEREQRSSEPIDVRANVNITAGVVTVTNQSRLDWREVELDLNSPSGWSDGYTYEVERLPSGEEVEIPIREFTDSDGRRFNTSTHRPENFTIVAETSDGRAIWTGEW